MSSPPPAPLKKAVEVDRVPIIVTSDFNCPWCYVAHKEIQSALARARQDFPDVPFELEYRPYELDPTLPKAQDKPMCKVACYLAKFGGEQKMNKVCDLLKARGKEVGIDFKFSGKTRQTTNAHRLSFKAWVHGREPAQTKMMDALFAAYFEQETDIGCYDFLSKAAESTGLMSYEDARNFLASDTFMQEHRMLLNHAEINGIRGIPYFSIGQLGGITGAAGTETYYKAFQIAAQIYMNSASNTTLGEKALNNSGPSCQQTTTTSPRVSQSSEKTFVEMEKTPIAV